ncbi:putative feruloyl esterase [Bisporella sp. PMI_857]|nr:putative feruloyl esterase [Bisporella sp. PMI_857]
MVVTACTPSTFTYPTLPRASFQILKANPVRNYSAYVQAGCNPNHGSINVVDADFCNVTITYTHPGQNDTLHVAAFLAMTAAVGQGYAAVSNLAAVSLYDGAVIGKSVIKDFYGQPPMYSYWSGCSQGRRQGMMLAQRYPEAYDGIAAGAPAFNFGQFSVADYWTHFIMDKLKAYPYPCELNAIRVTAIAACDASDGIIDGVISDPDICHFDATTLIGTTINCTDTRLPLNISSTAVTVAQAVLSGARDSSNSSLWYGMNQDAVLTSDLALAGTSCTTNGTCTRTQFSISEDWIKLFLLKNRTANLSTMTHADFEHIFHASVQQYTSIMGTNDPDLREFHERGGKMITYHGLADPIISPLGSKHYYDAVQARHPNAHEFYRLFFAPGLGHCYGGTGAYPNTTFEALQTWVETGVAPDTLNATSLQDNEGEVLNRPLCPYPQKQYYDGTGDTRSKGSFYCK